MKDLSTQLAILTDSVAEIVPLDAFKVKLATAIETQTPLRIKFGADPSRPDLHLGHTVVLRKLRQFQDCGHHVDFIIGDFTASIGDPTGRNKTRPPLTAADIAAYSETYQAQVFQILDPKKTTVHYNSHWLGALSQTDLIRWLSTVTVQQLLARDDFSKRYHAQIPIHLHECLYPVLQAYDSVHVRADIECGGTDQKFNLLLARDFQKTADQPQQAVLMMPILEGLDGEKKMSKSLGNAIGITDTPADMFGKIMSIADPLMFRYYALLTDWSSKRIDDLRQAIESEATHPMDAKKQLAHLIVTERYDTAAADTAHAQFERQFSKSEYPDSMPDYSHATPQIHWPSLLVDAAMAPSKKEARRLLEQGAIKLNRVPQTELDINWDQTTSVVQVGKRKFFRLIAE
jgi:tyrosyl-tRNA synthetase